MKEKYDSIRLWASSFPFSDTPSRRNVHVRQHQEMERQLREVARIMQQRGIIEYRVSFEWQRMDFEGPICWLDINIDYNDGNEWQDEQEEDEL